MRSAFRLNFLEGSWSSYIILIILESGTLSYKIASSFRQKLNLLPNFQLQKIILVSFKCFFFFCPVGMKIEFSKLKKRVRACGHLVHDYPRYEHRCGSNSYQPPAILFLLVWSTPWQISITRGIFKILREENVQIKSSSGKRILMYLPWYSAVTYSVASVSTTDCLGLPNFTCRLTQ